jgi:hypothetical protein
MYKGKEVENASLLGLIRSGSLLWRVIIIIIIIIILF